MLQGPSTSTYIAASSINVERAFDTTQIPSISAVQSCSISNEDTINNNIIKSVNNTVINVPTDLGNPGSSIRTEPSISMTCHNCTINYNFYK